MLIRELRTGEKDQYNSVVNHPLQTWEWGEFRETTGVQIVRIGIFDGAKIIKGCTLTFHPVPKTSFTVGYLPKSFLPDSQIFEAVKKLGQLKNCLFIKIEPEVKKPYLAGQPPL